MRKIMITGGFGFIGSNLIRHWLHKYTVDHVVCLDALTYAAREDHVLEFSALHNNKDRFQHVYVDIRNQVDVRRVVRLMRPDHIIHLAAESHVCRSIDGPKDFIHSNIVGTFNLLEAFRELGNGGRFHHVSTDEVYGELKMDEDELFHERRAYAPRSPYAASKAASDHLVNAWHHTYGLNTIITNCSNNFGPNQHDEKLVPKAILSAIRNQPMTVYGNGNQVRDWLYVFDHCTAIDTAFHNGTSGETYCVGGSMEMSNHQMIRFIDTCVRKVLDRDVNRDLVNTNDRPTDDLRYAINSLKMQSLGWSAFPDKFDEKMRSTVSWYAQRELELQETMADESASV